MINIFAKKCLYENCDICPSFNYQGEKWG